MNNKNISEFQIVVRRSEKDSKSKRPSVNIVPNDNYYISTVIAGRNMILPESVLIKDPNSSRGNEKYHCTIEDIHNLLNDQTINAYSNRLKYDAYLKIGYNRNNNSVDFYDVNKSESSQFISLQDMTDVDYNNYIQTLKEKNLDVNDMTELNAEYDKFRYKCVFDKESDKLSVSDIYKYKNGGFFSYLTNNTQTLDIKAKDDECDFNRSFTNIVYHSAVPSVMVNGELDINQFKNNIKKHSGVEDQNKAKVQNQDKTDGRISSVKNNNSPSFGAEINLKDVGETVSNAVNNSGSKALDENGKMDFIIPYNTGRAVADSYDSGNYSAFSQTMRDQINLDIEECERKLRAIQSEKSNMVTYTQVNREIYDLGKRSSLSYAIFELQNGKLSGEEIVANIRTYTNKNGWVKASVDDMRDVILNGESKNTALVLSYTNSDSAYMHVRHNDAKYGDFEKINDCAESLVKRQGYLCDMSNPHIRITSPKVDDTVGDMTSRFTVSVSKNPNDEYAYISNYRSGITGVDDSGKYIQVPKIFLEQHNNYINDVLEDTYEAIHYNDTDKINSKFKVLDELPSDEQEKHMRTKLDELHKVLDDMNKRDELDKRIREKLGYLYPGE